MWLFSHSFYSPGLAPCYFFIFAGMKSHLQWLRFQDFSEIQEQSLTCSTPIPKFSSSSASSSGQNAGPIAKTREGTTTQSGKFLVRFHISVP
jgi:hypothetical protein